MSALGHKRTYAAQKAMSALPPKSGRSLREPLVALTSDFPERKFVVV
jgi:hypothetical protein